MKEINLLGKDYFTEQEAAVYACVSYSQFRDKAREYGLLPFRFMGKLVYRRADIQRVMEREAEWQHTTSTKGRGISNGGKTVKGLRNGLGG